MLFLLAMSRSQFYIDSIIYCKFVNIPSNFLCRYPINKHHEWCCRYVNFYEIQKIKGKTNIDQEFSHMAYGVR